VADAFRESLRLFFEYLDVAEWLRCPWATSIFADRGALRIRLLGCPDDMDSDEGRAWNLQLVEDLRARLFLPEYDRDGGIVWGRDEGPVQDRLVRDLTPRWLAWRDDVIRGGITKREAVLRELLERQRA